MTIHRSPIAVSHRTATSIKRRRRCKYCEKRFTTYERVERIGLTIVKRDNKRQEYSRDKLRRSIEIACTKRPVSADQLEEAVNDIEAELFRESASEVPSTTVGELVMQHLRELDEVAYIRFASVYRNFADLEEMREAMEGLTGGPLGAQRDDSEDDSQPRGKARG